MATPEPALSRTGETRPMQPPQAVRGSSRRAFYRVMTVLPVCLTRLEQGDAEALAKSVGTWPDEEESPVDSLLTSQLRRIESKLDLLLAHFGHALGPSLAPSLDASDDQLLVLSGAGLRADAGARERSLAQGDRVSIDLVLPDSRPRPVRALGRVVALLDECAPLRGRSVAVAFEVIDERDRDAIVRHTYDVQRLELRTRARAEREE